MEKILEKFTLEFWGEGKHKISFEKFFEKKDAILLDVRSEEEVKTLAIRLDYHPNVECLTIPLNELPKRIGEIPKDKPIALFCSGGTRSTIAYVYLLSKGYEDLYILVGGYSDLTEAILPGKVLKVLQNNRE